MAAMVAVAPHLSLGFWGSVALGAASGAAATGSLEGALWGAFAAGAFYGVGQGLSGLEKGGLTFGERVTQAVAHGVTGGVIAEMQGGKFGHGFISAGVSKAATPAVMTYVHGPATQAVTLAIVGGTVSEVTGGKFANGAVTSAMAFAFNQMSQSSEEEATRIGISDRNTEGGYGSYEEAAIAQHQAYDAEYQATSMNEELLGFIGSRSIEGSTRYYFSEMILVDSTFNLNVIPVGPKDMTIVSFSHTHPAVRGVDQERFSRSDARFVGTSRNPGFPMNVRTPSGDLRYLTPDTSRGIRPQAGASLCSQRQCLPAHRNHRD